MYHLYMNSRCIACGHSLGKPDVSLDSCLHKSMRDPSMRHSSSLVSKTPTKPAVCQTCHDATCPCGKVAFATEAELVAALRVCREKLRADLDAANKRAEVAEAEIARLRECIEEIKADVAKAIEAGRGCVIHGCWNCDGGEAAMDAVCAINAKHEVKP